MESRDRILIMQFNQLSTSRRVQRQIEFLAPRYDVVVAAFDCPDGLPISAFVRLDASSLPRPLRSAEAVLRSLLRMAGRFRLAFWMDSRMRRWRRQLIGVGPVSAVVANDLAALPLAFAIAGDGGVIFDAHEHWTSESVSWTRRQRISMGRAHEWLVDRFVTRTAGLMTVSDGIACDYRKRTGKAPALVTNAPFAVDLEPSPVVPPIRLLHVGMADRRRRLEDTIDAARLVASAFTLDLVLLPSDRSYYDELERNTADDPTIRLMPPLPAHELIPFANAYDVGVFLLPGDAPNFVHVLPNKLFDYLQARLAIAIGPSPEMAKIVTEWDCGIISESFAPESFAGELSKLTVARVKEMKRNADRAASVLTADGNRLVLLDLVARATARPPVEVS